MNVWGVTFFSLLWVLATWGRTDRFSVAGLTAGAARQWPWEILLYLGLAATSLVAFLQAIGQRRIKAPQAAILYTLEPVFACITAYFYSGISLHPRGYAGSALILSAAILSQLPSADRTLH
jgi:drug/metabolite transporter (DMT)-like permease